MERFVVYCMTPLSLAGLFLLFRKDRPSAWLCLICLGLFPLVYYAVQYEYRYRYTILWVTFLLGALPITSIAQRVYQSIFQQAAKRAKDGCLVMILLDSARLKAAATFEGAAMLRPYKPTASEERRAEASRSGIAVKNKRTEPNVVLRANQFRPLTWRGVASPAG